MEYLIDSNALIDAHMKWYQPVVFKSVWTFLAGQQNVKMTSFVYHEIKYPDSLVDWTKGCYQKAQLKPTPEIIAAYREVMDWVTHSTRWNAAGLAEWQDPDKADPWLIATAKVNHQVIVTLDGNGRATMPDVGAQSKREPKIAAVAKEFGVDTLTIYELLRQLNLKL